MVASQTVFPFGQNWRIFVKTITEKHAQAAEDSLKDMLEMHNFDGKTFLDVGCGSGLSSLAARRLGASVHSFDSDIHSVSSAQELKCRFFPNDKQWTIEIGSVLDTNYLNKLGTFDVVYSWGVLHHTGKMSEALENVVPLVRPQGKLFIAIYNDQGKTSLLWLRIKRFYNIVPTWLKPIILVLAFVRLWGPTLTRDTLRGRPSRTWKNYSHQRGMSPWYDVVDWVGGYPFEVAVPETIVDRYLKKGFVLKRLKTCGCGHGCNEYVFQKSDPQ